ncbi:MAG: hypothetical protein ACREIT_04460, partial [Tepidisphaeraceae bacterium]
PPWGNGTTYTPGVRVRTTPPDRDWVCIREHTSATANDEPGSGANYTQYWTPQPAAVATTPVILDAWSNPILFVPGGGLADVLTTEAPAYDPGTPYAKSQVVRHTPSAPAGAKEQSFRALRSTTGDEPGVAGSEDDWAPAARSPDKRPFFASAGEDGDFSKGDDNLYSFEN